MTDSSSYESELGRITAGVGSSSRPASTSTHNDENATPRAWKRVPRRFHISGTSSAVKRAGLEVFFLLAIMNFNTILGSIFGYRGLLAVLAYITLRVFRKRLWSWVVTCSWAFVSVRHSKPVATPAMDTPSAERDGRPRTRFEVRTRKTDAVFNRTKHSTYVFANTVRVVRWVAGAKVMLNILLRTIARFIRVTRTLRMVVTVLYIIANLVHLIWANRERVSARDILPPVFFRLCVEGLALLGRVAGAIQEPLLKAESKIGGGDQAGIARNDKGKKKVEAEWEWDEEENEIMKKD